uniref:Uncharacterized protein n=1 Tax=Magallana gigas TaxID=29159 RepID=K1R871_MAGGI
MSARRILSESALNCQLELRGNAVTRRGSSVRTPRSPSGRREHSTLTLAICLPTARRVRLKMRIRWWTRFGGSRLVVCWGVKYNDGMFKSKLTPDEYVNKNIINTHNVGIRFQCLLLFLALPDLANSAHTAADGLYLGIGYNLIKGNPDGGEWAKLGQDPGLQLTRNILETDIDGNSYIKRTSYPQCTQMSSTSVFYDPESYKEYLLHYISSPVYQDIKQRTLSQHDVFRDEITSCTSEHARYVHPIVPVERNLVSNEFSHDVCKLPLTYDRDSYRSFLDRWGTNASSFHPNDTNEVDTNWKEKERKTKRDIGKISKQGKEGEQLEPL